MLASTRRRWGLRLLIALGGIAGLAVALRLVADPLAARYARRMFASRDHTSTNFDSVHLSFFPLRVRIDELRVIESEDGDWKAPLFYAKSVSVALRWSSLLLGKPAGHVTVGAPKLTLLPPSARRNSPIGFEQLLPRFPVRIETLEVADGEVLLTLGTGKNAAKIWFHDLHGAIAKGRPDSEVFTGEATGILQKTGKLSLDLTVHPAADSPTFSVRAELRALEMRDMYELLAAKADLQASRGEIAMSADLGCVSGVLSGTVKTVLENPELRPIGDSVSGGIKAAMVAAGVAARAEKAGGDRTLTTVVPVRGKLSDPIGQLLAALLDSIQDSFAQGLMHGFDRRR